LKSIRSRRRRPLRAVDIALLAVPDVELVPHDRKEEGMGAVQQLAVGDGMNARVRRYVVGASPVPAEAMAVFGFHGGSVPIIMGLEVSST
jgi:hypothetical protein